MNHFTACFAGRQFTASFQHPTTCGFCETFICNGTPEISIALTQADIEYERIKAAREDEIEGLPVREYSDAYLETLALLRKVTEALFDYDTILFHGSVVAVDGKAYLFTARSDIRKSPNARNAFTIRAACS